jgi:hypothetical protein
MAFTIGNATALPLIRFFFDFLNLHLQLAKQGFFSNENTRKVLFFEIRF